MEPAELIRLSSFTNEQKYMLLNIIRGNDVVNQLINYIAIKEDVLNDLKAISDRKQVAAESFASFVENFQRENNRYPSIDEAWNASWNSYKESMRGV